MFKNQGVMLANALDLLDKTNNVIEHNKNIDIVKKELQILSNEINK